jgi:hypothetical protein
MCIISAEKECGRAILATERLAKESAIEVEDNKVKLITLTHIVEGLVLAVDKLIEKHEKEEQEVINRLKIKLTEKDNEIEKKEELEENRKWQVKMALLIASLGFISAFVMYYISIKG